MPVCALDARFSVCVRVGMGLRVCLRMACASLYVLWLCVRLSVCMRACVCVCVWDCAYWIAHVWRLGGAGCASAAVDSDAAAQCAGAAVLPQRSLLRPQLACVLARARVYACARRLELCRLQRWAR